MPITLGLAALLCGTSLPLQFDTCATAAPARFVASGASEVILDTMEAPEASDHFRIAVAAGQRIEVTLTFDQAALDMDLRLWSGDCASLVAVSSGTVGVETVSWSNSTGAPMEVVAEALRAPVAIGSATYEMRLEAIQLDCSFVDRYEPNPSCSSAPLVQESASDLFLPLSLPVGDDDWLGFDLAPNSSTRFTVDAGQSPGDTVFEIWSEDCQTMVADGFSGPVDVTNSSSVRVRVNMLVYRADDQNVCSTYQVIRAVNPGIAECTSAANSTGQPARLFPEGTASLALNNLTLDAGPVPSGVFGLYVYGPDAGSQPLGDGTLCIGLNGLVRGPVSGASGQLLLMPVDVSAPAPFQPSFHAGETVHFQAWFRDITHPTGFGLSDAIRLTFVP